MSRAFVLLSLLLGVVYGQDPSGNPIYDVQYGADAIHQMYEATFDNIRFYSSDILNEQNNELLEVVLYEISSWDLSPEVVDIPSSGCTSCGCTGGCGGGAAAADPEAPEQSTSSCGCSSCGCTGGCGAAVAEPTDADTPQQNPPCGCTSCGCSGSCGSAASDPTDADQPQAVIPSCGCTGGCGAQVSDPSESDSPQQSSPCSGCSSCGCSTCNQQQAETADIEQHAEKAEPVEERLRKIMATFSTEAIGKATKECIFTARKTLQDRQEAILMEIERGRYKSTELQYKAIAGLEDFNILVDHEKYYDTMTPVIYEYYNHLVNEIYPTLEILVGNLEYNRDILTVALRGCLENVAKRHL